MRKVDYKKIWEVYKIPEDQELYHNARQRIRKGPWREYLKELGKPENFPWDCLSKLEQDKFIYDKIKDFMIKNYVPDRVKETVESNVDRYIANSPLAVDKRIQARNESEINLYRNHRVTTYSDDKKQKAYRKLCSDIQNHDANIPLPTYEEFEKRLSLKAASCTEEADYEARVQDMEMACRRARNFLESSANGVAMDDEEAMAKDRARAEAVIKAEDEEKAKGQPIKAYDYVMDYEATTCNFNVPGATEIYVRIILKVLEEELDLKVDYAMINEYLLCKAKSSEYFKQKGIDVDNYGKLTKEYVESDNGEESEIVYIKFPTEYDEDNMDMTEEEFKELKKRYAEFLHCKKKLNDLKSLYQYKKKPTPKPR